MTSAVAAIDVGTNTARLLIARFDSSGRITPILLKRHITRLGGGFSRETGISREARERTVSALADFAEEIRRHGVTRVRAVATSAVRDAANGRAFCDEAFAVTGIRIEIIDGKKEGVLTLRGVMAEIDDRSGNFLVFDVGGGSTEFTLARGEEMLFTRSLPLGVVRLTEGKATPEAMEEKITRELTGLRAEIQRAGLLGCLDGATLVGTAGTATTLAAIDLGLTEYDYRLVNNHTLSREGIRRIYETLLPLTPAERLTVPGMEKGREDLIIAGILITLRTMEMFGLDRLKVSDFGLLEGVLLQD